MQNMKSAKRVMFKQTPFKKIIVSIFIFYCSLSFVSRTCILAYFIHPKRGIAFFAMIHCFFAVIHCFFCNKLFIVQKIQWFIAKNRMIYCNFCNTPLQFLQCIIAFFCNKPLHFLHNEQFIAKKQ